MSTVCTGVASVVLWQHSIATRRFFGFYPTRFVIPMVATTAIIADKVVSHLYRRGYYAMDRYDRDWRNMPTGV